MELPKNTPKAIELCISEYFDDFEGDITQEDFNGLHLEEMYWGNSVNTQNPCYIREDIVKQLLKTSAAFGWQKATKELSELLKQKSVCGN